jgi:acyl carrier protein
MLNKDTILFIILQALNNIHEERDPMEKLKVDLTTRLFGDDAVLDSLSLVSVIVDVESALSEHSGREICLTDDRAMGQEVSPFTDVNSLASYIELLLSEVV